ncbi:hypothetical protein NY08_1278 [Rhodococcus sp. B7740]|nr:hypothetical protein NY08_1278 [Rhodococcus sp. B7740]
MSGRSGANRSRHVVLLGSCVNKGLRTVRRAVVGAISRLCCDRDYSKPLTCQHTRA